jgi:hypothetical protein
MSLSPYPLQSHFAPTPDAVVHPSSQSFLCTCPALLPLVRKAVDFFQVKLLVNAAGVHSPEPFLKSQDGIDHAYAVNFVGPVGLLFPDAIARFA